MKKYMALGLKTALKFVEKATHFYQEIFNSYDKKKELKLDFKVFESLIHELDPERP
jgi:hypothetical protein